MRLLQAWRVMLFLLAGSVAAGCGGPVNSVPVSQPAPPLATTQFIFSKPNIVTPASSGRRPLYVTNAVTSVKITLTSVNGSAPPANIAATTSNITVANCPCTVAGPSVPPGTDGFTLTAYDSASNVVSTATPTLKIVTSQTNTETITLNGVPVSFHVTPPSATAGTAFGTPQAISVTVLDADGNTIMGGYANPIALTNGDASGATTLATSGADSPGPSQLLSSSDAATLAYTGLAIAPATIGASATGATANNGSFAPALQPVATNATAGVFTLPFVGTPHTATLTASEAGWTNAPYNKPLTVTQSASCTGVATISGTTSPYTVTMAPGATQGATCTVTLSDSLGGTNLASLTVAAGGSQTFVFTGAPATFAIPGNIALVQIAAIGASGGSSAGTGGLGGVMTATFPVGAALTVTVGGAGGNSNNGAGPGTAGGYPDGGAGGSGTTTEASGGGGSSSVVQGASVLLNAAGGGGGSRGGAAGYPNGANGNPGSTAAAGGGGTSAAGGGGGAGTSGGANGPNGGANSGGAGPNGGDLGGGGGGGGFFGGGAGGADGTLGGAVSGGGGGASYYDSTIGTNQSNGAAPSHGNGTITISW
jgi:hypothetical protein